MGMAILVRYFWPKHLAEVATDIKKRSTVEIVEPKTMKACSAFQERPAE